MFENGQAEVFWARKQDLEFLGIFENQGLIVNGREKVTNTSPHVRSMD